MSGPQPEADLWEGHPSYWNWWLEVAAADLCAVGAALLGLKGLGPLPVASALALAAAIHVFVYTRRRGRLYRLTSQRAVMRLGVLSKRVSEVEVRDIRSINLSQGLLQRLVGIGNVEISSAGEGVEVVFEGIARAEEVKELVRGARLSAGEKVPG